MKKIIFTSLILCGICIYTIIKADTGDITLEIIKGPIAIDTSGSIDIGTINNIPTTGESTGSFSTDTFMMIDKRGGPGYYTTIQFDDLTKGNDTIANTFITYKALSTPTLIQGQTGYYMRFGSGIKALRGNVHMPMTYFVRKSHEGTGEVGKFGDIPEIAITIPANQTGGEYTGIIYYTLIDSE